MKKLHNCPIKKAKDYKESLENYFKPGAIVEGYANQKDLVIAFRLHPNSWTDWEVDVREITPNGLGRLRTHCTPPELHNKNWKDKIK